MRTKNSKLVYSTDQGRIREEAQSSAGAVDGDGIIRIQRETKGRKGKGVTVLSGFQLDESAMKAMCKQMKNICGSGGTIKERNIEIQGDHREKLKKLLESKGLKVKLAGG